MGDKQGEEQTRELCLDYGGDYGKYIVVCQRFLGHEGDHEDPVYDRAWKNTRDCPPAAGVSGG